MEKQREELLEKLFKEMVCAFRSMKPDGHDHEHQDGFAHKFGGRFGALGAGKFGRGHLDLFFRLKKEKDGVSVKEIAESLNITSGAVTQMVDRAVEMGIVTRQENPDDRRSQRVKLSEKAQDRIKAFRQGFLERLGPKFASLTDKEISQLTNLLGKINSSEGSPIKDGTNN